MTHHYAQPLTEKQKKVLRRIMGDFLDRRRGHTLRELGEEMGISYAGVRSHLVSLRVKGYLKFGGGKSRSILPTEKAQAMTWNIFLPSM